MKIVGLIAEYNPFHYGHLYHLQKAKEVTSSAGSVAVMSGDFVQRGEPAIADKYARARMALEAGVDAVLELPVYYATGSAERFAAGAVGILHALGCVENVVYGCEGLCNDRSGSPLIGAEEEELFARLAGILAEEPGEYRSVLREGLADGLSFPAARAKAAESVLPDASALLSQPNNTLGLEYRKAALRLGSHIGFAAIRRSDAGYYESGSEIRRAIAEIGGGAALGRLMPESSVRLLETLVLDDDLSSALALALIAAADEQALTSFEDVSPAIAARIWRLRGANLSFTEAAERVASKSLTEARARRVLLHVMLGIRSRESRGYEFPFIRVLGLRADSPVMRTLSRSSALPLVTKLADAPEGFWDGDHRASLLYSRILFEKYGIRRPDDYHTSPVII